MPFTLLNQESYKDDNGREIQSNLIDCIAPYKHIADGFYYWECGNCKKLYSTRSCGWPISGQMLRCTNCQYNNLLVRTNTIQLDEVIKNHLEVQHGLEDLNRDRTNFGKEVENAVYDKLAMLENTLESLLEEIRERRRSPAVEGRE